ncbi:MAG: DUF1257 domain-containing protein [Cyanobacteria bacterium K_DeepCast_35m_m2_023]|nr:DUF1257 domain-containing protein [Cyanobacteria bacterium K_DeepCast_35m_m2_023]
MSHFSTIKTELRDREALVAALTALGHAPSQGPRQVRGYRGQQELAELVVSPEQGGDLGFRLNASSGAYELVTDLDLWMLPVPPERFLAQLQQRYALEAILAASAAEGFQVSQQTSADDGSIELVVTRWA